MGMFRVVGAISVGALLLGLAGCGTAGTVPVSNLGVSATSSSLTSQSIPPQSSFVTIQCTVTQLLPADTNGLRHQRFDVEETAPDSNQTLEVDNDMTYGEEVPDLQVGERLVIRGVEYHDWNKNGIHWTHRANVAGDAGYIQTPDGTIYQ